MVVFQVLLIKFICFSAQNMPKVKSSQNLCIFENIFFIFSNYFYTDPYKNMIFCIVNQLFLASAKYQVFFGITFLASRIQKVSIFEFLIASGLVSEQTYNFVSHRKNDHWQIIVKITIFLATAKIRVFFGDFNLCLHNFFFNFESNYT